MMMKMSWNTMMRATPTSKQATHPILLTGLHVSITVLGFILTHQVDVWVFAFIVFTMIPIRLCKNAHPLSG